MYKRILIANRSDCAMRLIRACHEENCQACLIAARDDANSAACREADRVIFTGMSRDAYANEEDILEAARECECEAILPGWGFLSEDYTFARKCRFMGFHFIGPSARHLQIFGDKLKTIQTFDGLFAQPQTAISCAHPEALQRIRAEIQAPYMLKGRFGGGGKNVFKYASFDALCERLAQIEKTRESAQYFVEPAIENARHIEFQYFGDGCGDVRMLGARDCTLQKFHQKYFETSVDLSTVYPQLAATAERIRAKLADMQYAGAGTVETLVAQDGYARLLELNPRLQVEHGVTEMASRIDIVRSAIRTSCAGHMAICATDATDADAAAEFRLYARSTGALKKIGFDEYSWPDHRFASDPHYRIETAYREGDSITGVYDGLIARFMVCGKQENLRDKLRNWLDSFRIDGLESNLADLPD